MTERGEKKGTLVFISGCSVLSYGNPGRPRGRPHSVMDKSWRAEWTGQALGGYRLKLGVPVDLYAVRHPTLLEVTVPQSTLCQIPFCVQLSVRARKRNRLACKELYAAAAVLQGVPELSPLHRASLTCGSDTNTLH